MKRRWRLWWVVVLINVHCIGREIKLSVHKFRYDRKNFKGFQPFLSHSNKEPNRYTHISVDGSVRWHKTIPILHDSVLVWTQFKKRLPFKFRVFNVFFTFLISCIHSYAWDKNVYTEWFYTFMYCVSGRNKWYDEKRESHSWRPTPKMSYVLPSTVCDVNYQRGKDSNLAHRSIVRQTGHFAPQYVCITRAVLKIRKEDVHFYLIDGMKRVWKDIQRALLLTPLVLCRFDESLAIGGMTIRLMTWYSRRLGWDKSPA